MKTTLKATVLVLLVVPAAPAAAIDVPQTRPEFVRAVAAGARGVKMETLVVDRPFDDITRLFERKAAACLDVVVNRSGYVGTHMEVSSSDYNPTFRRAGRGRAEFALQVAHRPRGVGHTPPPGGLYVMAVDFRQVGPRRTEVVLYRPSIGGAIWTSVYIAHTEWIVAAYDAR